MFRYQSSFRNFRLSDDLYDFFSITTSAVRFFPLLNVDAGTAFGLFNVEADTAFGTIAAARPLVVAFEAERALYFSSSVS